MPAYKITNNRRGPWTLIRAEAKNIDLASGESVTVTMTESEAKNAVYPGVSIRHQAGGDEAEAGSGKGGKKGGDDFDRKDYLARAKKLELAHPGNISNDDLKQLVDEAEAGSGKGGEDE